ncbi:MAG: response regulator [Novosphingobium sp.]
MSLKAEIGPELPYLRRYARALTGSQTLGDAAVREVLEALLVAPVEFDESQPPRQELYRVFHKLWLGLSEIETSAHPDGGLVANLNVYTREALLLTAVEGFTSAQAAIILASSAATIDDDIAQARRDIADALQSNVLIIEDESIIALHIASIVEDLGHSVAGIARTRREATAMAAQTQPELVLADISLADGSSGIAAVKDILAEMDVPVIFITAFPERLLTGERPEPTYLIAKPFNPETVAATIGQALLFHRERAAAMAEPSVQVLQGSAADPRQHFDTPSSLVADPNLSNADKQALLKDWATDVDAQLNAEAEGMGLSDPLTAHDEGRLANEAQKVQTALTRAGDDSAD